MANFFAEKQTDKPTDAQKNYVLDLSMRGDLKKKHC